MIANRRLTVLLLLFAVIQPCVATPQTGCELPEVRRAKGFNILTGVVTMKDANGALVQTTVEKVGYRIFDKGGRFVGATFRYKAADGQELAIHRSADDLKAALVDHMRAAKKDEMGSSAGLDQLDPNTLKAVNFDVLSAQVTFHDRAGNCLVATTPPGMTFDFLSSDSHTGAKVFVGRRLVWAMAKGVAIPLTDAAGKTLVDVLLPSAVSQELAPTYE